MVADIIPHDCPAAARLRHHQLLHGDVVLWVVQVHQQDIEHQRGLWGNLRTWREDESWREEKALTGVRRRNLGGGLTRAFFAVGLEGWDDDVPDLPHTHPQQALVQALYQPALTHERVVGLLPGVATWGSYNGKVKHTTHLGEAVQIQNSVF